jgi:hypothetical protein
VARRLGPGRVVVALSLLLGFVVTGRVWLRPLVDVVQTHFTDGHLIAAELSARAVWSGEILGLWTSEAGGPGGVMLRPLLWPVVLLAAVVGPVLALNLAWALVPALGAVGGILLGHALGAGRWGRALTGGLLAWTSWVRVTLSNGQIEQAVLGLIAVTWAAMIWAESGPRRRILLAPLLLLATGLAAPNCGLSAAIGMGLLAIARAASDRRRAGRLGVLLLLAVAMTLVVHVYHAPNYAQVPNLFQPRVRGPGLQEWQSPAVIAGWYATATERLDDATLTALLVPAGPSAFGTPVQHVPYLGGGVLLAALLGLLRSRRRVGALSLAAAGLAVLSMGAAVEILGVRLRLPYELLVAVAPSAASSGSAYRFACGAIVALAAVAGVGLSEPTTWRGRAAIAALIAAAWAETCLLPGKPLPFDVRPALIHPELVALGDGPGAILDLPPTHSSSCITRTPHYLNGALAHTRPYLHNLNDGANYFANAALVPAIGEAIRSADCAERLPGLLEAAGVGALVMHLEPPCAPSDAMLSCAEDAFGAPKVGGGVRWWVLDGAP